MVEPAGWRGIDELAHLVGWYAWTEHRVFELTGEWSAASAEDRGADGVRVWCAAASRRHGALVGAWASHLPVRAGVDATALVTAPPGPLADCFDALGALPPAVGGVRVLVEEMLPGLDRLYARHQAAAWPASEAPVVECLVRAREVLAGERAAGRVLSPGMHTGFSVDPLPSSTFEQAFEEFGVFPAVRPS